MVAGFVTLEWKVVVRFLSTKYHMYHLWYLYLSEEMREAARPGSVFPGGTYDTSHVDSCYVSVSVAVYVVVCCVALP